MDRIFSTTPQLAVSSHAALTFNALAVAALALAALLPVAVLGYWLSVGSGAIAQATGLAPETLGALDAIGRLGAAGLSLLSVAPLSWGLVRLRLCLSEFALGRPFAPKGIAGLRDFAVGMALSAVAKPISITLLGLFLSWNAPAGQRQLIIQVDSDSLVMALFAGTVAALAWAMQRAAAIAEENSQFV